MIWITKHKYNEDEINSIVAVEVPAPEDHGLLMVHLEIRGHAPGRENREREKMPTDL